MAVKLKVEGNFLKGVGDDSRIIQGLINKDDCKELGQVQIMCHFETIKVARFKKMIEDEMKSLKLQPGKKGRKYEYT